MFDLAKMNFLINPSVRRKPTVKSSFSFFDQYYRINKKFTRKFMTFLMCTVGFASCIACMHFELRELENYQDAGSMRAQYYNETHGEDESVIPEYWADLRKFGVKIYNDIWIWSFFIYANMVLLIFPRKIIVALILSIIYACTASLDFIRGQPLTCPREYDPKFYVIPGIDGPLNLTCQYHIKVAVASWINAGIIIFSVMVYFLFIPIGILVHEVGVRIWEAIKNEWIYRKECFEAWKLQKKYREERTRGENTIDSVSRVGGVENTVNNISSANGEEKSEIRINIDGY